MSRAELIVAVFVAAMSQSRSEARTPGGGSTHNTATAARTAARALRMLGRVGCAARLDRLHRPLERLRQHAAADRPEDEAEEVPLEGLALAHHDVVDVRHAVG